MFCGIKIKKYISFSLFNTYTDIIILNINSEFIYIYYGKY